MNYFTMPGLKNQVYPVVADTIHEIIEPQKKVDLEIISPYAIMSAVCQAYQIQMSQLVEKTNARVSVEPRQVAMYLMKRKTALSLEKIGDKLGGKDHATVYHACKVVKNEIDTKSTMGNIATKLMQKL